MAKSRFSLRAKLTGAFLAPTLMIALLYGLVTYVSSRQGLEDELALRLIAVAQATAANMNDGFDAKQLTRLDPEKTRVRARLQDKLKAVRDTTGVRRVFIFDRQRRSLVDTDDLEFGYPIYALEADSIELDRTFAFKEPGASTLFKGNDGQLYKSGYAPITLDGEVVAAVGVEGSASYFELLTNLATVLALLGVAGVFLVILVATISARKITRPVNELVAAARRLGRGDLSNPVAISRSQDELGFLAEAFEEMRQDIVGRDEQMQMMLSGIAHEVRNPLGGMKLFVGLLQEDLDPSAEADALDKVNKIGRELDYLERVVNDFLDFAKKAPANLERFTGAEFLDEITGLLATEVEQAGAALVTHATPADVQLTADRSKLRRAVINCVRNAYQALEVDGEITIAIQELGELRRIIIADNGPGIPMDSLDEVMTPFFTTKEKGSGLGLSLTKRVLEQHQGTLLIENEGGCKITMEIPFNHTTAQDSTEVPEGWLG